MSKKEPIWERLPFPLVAIGGAVLAPIIIPTLLAKTIYDGARSEKEYKDSLIAELKSFGVSEEEAKKLVSYKYSNYGYRDAEYRLKLLKKKALTTSTK
jgi:hypothetical protein